MSTTHPRQTTNPPDSTRVQSDASPPQTMEFSNDSTNPSFGALPPGGVPGYPFLSLPQAEDEIGRLGDYRILKKLGEGGMGFVFRGEDPGLKRSVALKVMRPEVAAKPLATDRFLREGRAAAGLKSDHIITIYQVGQANGVPFLAMEFLEGLPLDEWIKQQKKAIPLPHVLRIVRDTLRGLAVAHDKGLIHRDIKPANLWLEKGTARIKLLDFGLTRGTDADMQLTQEGAVVGTPAFMAPEQASGKPVDPRADLFSVGTVMYLLLAGKNPFARGSLMETLGAVGFETQAPVASVRPDVPKPYSDLLDRLLAKSPDGRPANAKAALQELATIEKALADSAKTSTSSQPLLAVPLPAPAAAPQVWGELEDETEPTVRVPKAAPVGPKPPANKKLLYGGGLFAFLLLLGGIVIIITNKDGTQTKVELPDGAKVEVKDKGKTVASVGGKNAPPTKVAADLDRTAAEKLLPFVDLDIRLAGRAEAVKLKVGSQLPAEKFVVTGVSISNGARFPRTFGQDVLLPAVAPLSNLLTLIDTGSKVDMAGADVAKWSGLASRETLTNFELAVPLSDAWIDAFAQFPKLTAIHILNVKAVPTPVLRRLSAWKALDSLRLDNLEGKDKWDAIIALPLKRFLVTISPDMDAAVCSRIAAMPKLEYLALYGVSITVEMLTALEPAPSLKSLSFTQCALPAKGFESLTKMRNLGSLNIRSNELDDGHLAQLAGVDKLHYLDVRETRVTEAGLNALAAKLPNCSILWNGGTLKGR